MKKTLAILLSLWLFCCFTAGTLSASAAEPFGLPAWEENPLYSGVSAEYGAVDAVSAKAVSASAGYYAEGETLYAQIKQHLLRREGSFTIKLVTADRLTSGTTRMNLLRRLFFAATEDSRSVQQDDGDYLRLAVAGYGYNAFTEDTVTGSSLHYYTITAQFTYFSTAAQEQQVAKVVDTLTKELNAAPLTDYQRLLRVHQYICDHATYNATANNTVHSAYGALIGGKAACQGYASAFYRLSRALGYSARIITSAKNSGNHAWNLVGIGGKFYYADCTWDDENIDGKTGKSKVQCFLVNEKTLQQYDSAAQEHTPDAQYYNTAYYNRCYRDLIDSRNYDHTDRQLLSNCVITYSGKRLKGQEVIVRTLDGKRLTAGVHYHVLPQTLRYGSRYWCVSGKGSYSGLTQRRSGSGKQAPQRAKLKE